MKRKSIVSVFFYVAMGIPCVVYSQHDHDPVPIQDEHGALFDLVRYEDATHWAVQSGDWQHAATWEDEEIPGDDARIVIAEDVVVTLSTVNGPVYYTIRVDGKLTFATDRNTALKVDTLVVSPQGHLEIGNVSNPVSPDVVAKIVIADTGPIDLEWDPRELSRGLICHGRATIHGAVKTPHVDLAAHPHRKDKVLHLEHIPVDWVVGDMLILPGTHKSRDRDEILIITGFTSDGVEVSGIDDNGQLESGWRGLSKYHSLPEGLMPFVMNVSRNVVVESENVSHSDEWGINRRRGHVIFMHSGVSKTDTRYVGAYGLGRRDKRTRLESPEIDDHGHRLPETGHNTVGRYGWHFHRGGPTQPTPAVVVGLAIVDSPGLGLVNHSSNVEVSDSGCYNAVGSCWFIEGGDETGFFDNVVSVRTVGSGEGIESRRGDKGGPILETGFGHSGHGFWLQGGGVELRDVKVAGSGNAGIIFFTVPLDEDGIGVGRFAAELLDDPSIANGAETVPVGTVPLVLEDAFVFGCRQGIETKFHQLQSKHNATSLIRNATTASTGTGLSIRYTNQLVVADSSFIGYERKPSRSRAMRRNEVTRNIHFDNLTIKWWGHGVDIPVKGDNRVTGGVYQNVRDINICTTKDDRRSVLLEGDISFPDLTDDQLTSYYRGKSENRRYQVYLRTKFKPKMNDLTRIFMRDIIRLGTLKYEDMQLYYHAQAADFVPFPQDSAADYIPADIIDMTNAELWAEYGLSVGDAIAPEDAFVDPVIHALIGDPTEYPPRVKLRNRRYTNQLEGYRLKYTVYYPDGTDETVRVDEKETLGEDWNFITIKLGEYLRTFLIFGDITPPEFELSSKVDTVVNPLDLKRGFVISGTILDNSFGEKRFRKRFKGKALLELPVMTRDDGSQFIALEFEVKDFAKNATPYALEVDLDPDAPRASKKKRKKLDSRKVTKALKRLLGVPEESAAA